MGNEAALRNTLSICPSPGPAASRAGAQLKLKQWEIVESEKQLMFSLYIFLYTFFLAFFFSILCIMNTQKCSQN